MAEIVESHIERCDEKRYPCSEEHEERNEYKKHDGAHGKMEPQHEEKNKEYGECNKKCPERMEYGPSNNYGRGEFRTLEEMCLGPDARRDVFRGIGKKVPRDNAEEKIYFIVWDIDFEEVEKYDVEYTEHHKWFNETPHKSEH